MKKLMLSLSVILGTFAIGLTAIAVAQRDARNRRPTDVGRPDYSTQTAMPIRYSPEEELNETVGLRDVPPPLSRNSVVRGNDDGPNPRGGVYQATAQELLNAPTLPNSGSISGGPSIGAGLPALPALGGGGSPSNESRNLESNRENLAQPRRASTARTNFPSTFQSQAPNLASQSNFDPPLESVPNGAAGLPSLGDDADESTSNETPSLNEAPRTEPTRLESPSNALPNLSTNAVNPQGVRGTRQSYQPASRDIQSESTTNSFGQPTNAIPNPNPSLVGSNPVGTGTLSSQSTGNPNILSQEAHGLQQLVRPNNTFHPTSLRSAQLIEATPGQRGLDGAQNPSLQLQKRAPEEVQVDQPATFALIVRNVGNATAHEVTVFDRIPKGTRLTRMSPEGEQDGKGALTWNLGELGAGAERTITIELVPETEGEIGSVASVTFASQASVRTVSTLPRLEITQLAEPTVLVGEQTTIRIRVSNTGTGVARNVELEADIPDGLRFTQGTGNSFSAEIGDLAPGESQVLPLDLIGIQANNARNLIRAIASNAAVVESFKEIQVVAPQLKINLVGPKLRYLERQATYQLTVTNSGTSAAHNIDLDVYLPRCLQFNSAADGGDYLAESHVVTWGLEELRPGESVSTQFVVLPIEISKNSVIQMQAQADGVRAEPIERAVQIEGQSELAFTIEDDNDPIETDGQTTYAVKISNIGTRGDSAVVLAVELPQGAELLSVDAPVNYKVATKGIVFEPLPEMKAKDVQIYRFTVRLGQVGMQVVRASVSSNQRPTPVLKEESTEVYSDR